MIFLAQIQASLAGEIQHDGKKNPYLHTVKYGSKYGIMTYRTSEFFPNFIFTQHSKNHEAGGECVISLFLETHVYFPNERRSAIYTCACICDLQSLCNSPYEYFLRRYSYTETNHTNNN